MDPLTHELTSPPTHQLTNSSSHDLACKIGGVIKALGLQGMAAVYTFIGYYLVGLPLAYILAYKSPNPHIQGFTGMYLGFICGTVFVNICLARQIYCT